MPRDSLIQRQDIFMAAAAVGAHANSKGVGFRQKEVRFLIELFSGWLRIPYAGSSFSIQNTQIQRYLNFLVKEGFAKSILRRKTPTYALTRTGLLNLVSAMLEKPYYIPFENCFFAYYFAKSYRPVIESLVQEEGRSFPYALKVELQAMLDPKEIIRRQLDFVEREILKLEDRVISAKQAAALATSMYNQGKTTEQIALEVERNFPYELNYQKSFSELFREIMPHMRKWELETGTLFRRNFIWEPLCQNLKSQRASLLKLAENET